ncbi:hypothetical protein IG631_12659 [Alternaria alternata]|nr:hypothetical protein IG631_12659 [Alternaria alternata]
MPEIRKCRETGSLSGKCSSPTLPSAVVIDNAPPRRIINSLITTYAPSQNRPTVTHHLAIRAIFLSTLIRVLQHV